jgi:hypothetical protein
MLGPIAQSISDIYKIGNGEDYSKRTAEVMTNYADVIGEFAKKNQGLMFLNYGVQDQTLQQMNSVLSQTLQTLNRQRELSAAQVETSSNVAKPATDAAKSLEDVIKSLNQLKMDIDDQTIKSFGNMAKVTTNLIGVMTELYKMLTPETMGDVMVKFTSAIKEATDALKGLSNAGGGGGPKGKPPTPEEQQRDWDNAHPWWAKKRDTDKPRPTAPPPTPVPIKSPESTAGGPTGEKIQAVVDLIGSKYGDVTITAFDDAWHRKHRPDSPHTKGMAADLRIPNLDANMVAEINKLIAGKGKADMHQNANGPGQHLHVEAMSKGGITNGISIAGEAGPEAVIPLPDGRTIPVRMDNSELINAIRELIAVAKEQRDNSEQMLYAVQ